MGLISIRGFLIAPEFIQRSRFSAFFSICIESDSIFLHFFKRSLLFGISLRQFFWLPQA